MIKKVNKKAKKLMRLMDEERTEWEIKLLCAAKSFRGGIGRKTESARGRCVRNVS